MIDREVFQTKSKNLSVNLKDCEKYWFLLLPWEWERIT